MMVGVEGSLCLRVSIGSSGVHGCCEGLNWALVWGLGHVCLIVSVCKVWGVVCWGSDAVLHVC